MDGLNVSWMRSRNVGLKFGKAVALWEGCNALGRPRRSGTATPPPHPAKPKGSLPAAGRQADAMAAQH
eukprot:357077-Chlamydomonas_euryale.AAC.3